MDEKIRITGIFPGDLVIRAKTDVRKFMNSLKEGSVDFDDVNDKRYYYSVCKESSGRVLFGHTKYGPDPILADPVMLDDNDIVNRMYAARKSINTRFFNRGE